MLKRSLAALAALAAFFVSPAQAAFDGGAGICETSTTTGTGTLNLGGAYTTGGITYLGFASQITSGAIVNYTIRSSDGKFEHGTGAFTDAGTDTLARTNSIVSSDGVGSALTLPAGTHVVCLQDGPETWAMARGTQLYESDPGAVGAVLAMQHDSSSAVDGDIAADIQVYAGADDEEVGRIALEVDDGSTTSEDTQWRIFTDLAGSSAQRMAIGDGVIVGTGTTFPGAGVLFATLLRASDPTSVSFLAEDNSSGLSEVISNSGTGNQAQTIGRFTANSLPPRYAFGKSRGTAVNDFTIVSDGDDLGAILFAGADGVDFANGVMILGEVDGTPASDQMPGRLSVWTSAAASAVPTLRLTVPSTGGFFMPEISDPAAPAANNGHIYIRDNGSGKTQLVARFPSGAIQVIVTEP